MYESLLMPEYRDVALMLEGLGRDGGRRSERARDTRRDRVNVREKERKWGIERGREKGERMRDIGEERE